MLFASYFSYVIYCSKGACEENEFECANGECIDGNRKCDSIVDCFDDSDENGCGIYSIFDDSRLVAIALVIIDCDIHLFMRFSS